jgi:cytochrome P450
MTVPAVDLYEPVTFSQGIPYDYFRHLRDEAPVTFMPEGVREMTGMYDTEVREIEGPGFWSVTRYADVVEVDRNQALFSSWRGGTQIADPMNEAELAAFRTMLINMDPPEHTRLRKIVARTFTPRGIAQITDNVTRHAREVVDRVAGRGSCDFVTDVAAELPLLVLADLLGLPSEDRHRLFEWSNRLIGVMDPDLSTGVEDFQAAFVEMFGYGHELAARKRANPDGSVISQIVNADVDGEKLSEIEFDMFWELLVIAGNETTRNSTAGGLLALDAHPEQKARLLADLEGMLPTAVDEILRYVTPVMQFRRTATRDTVLGGQEIKEGDKVVYWMTSANRDERAFPDPDVFDVGRTPNEHVAFGVGPHFCLGAHLALVQLRTIFREVLTRLPDIRVVGPAERMHSTFINGYKHLPVEFTPSR